jgi:hypothetical protein
MTNVRVIFKDVMGRWNSNHRVMYYRQYVEFSHFVMQLINPLKM